MDGRQCGTAIGVILPISFGPPRVVLGIDWLSVAEGA